MKKVADCNEIQNILLKLDIAEAVNFATVGSQSKKGSQQLQTWRRRQINRIKELTNQKINTVWDSLRRKKSTRI